MTIELAPELEAAVARAAAERGVDPGKYVSQIVASSLEWRRQPDMEREDIRVFLDRLASMGRPVDTLPTDTFSREMIYPDDMEKYEL